MVIYGDIRYILTITYPIFTHPPVYVYMLYIVYNTHGGFLTLGIPKMDQHGNPMAHFRKAPLILCHRPPL